LVTSFEQSVPWQTDNGRGKRPGLEQSAWTQLNASRLADAAFKGFFTHQVETWLVRYNQDLSLSLPVPLRPKLADLRIKRYRANTDEHFQPHFDAVDEESGRHLVFLWYLNDVAQGGETEFIDLGMKVAARKGRLLVFPPYWMFQHAGLPPHSGSKYILSTYLEFGPVKV
jgi:prolyl 4-hydroxylase